MSKGTPLYGTPFSIIENKYFQECLNRMRPSYQVPTRKTLATTLLDNGYTFINYLINDKISEADYITIMTDVNGTPIINITSIFIRENSHTGDYVAEILCDIIEKIGHDKFTALVTDNAANMKAALKIVEKNYPHIQSFWCDAHGSNIFAKDILGISSISGVICDAREMIIFF